MRARPVDGNDYFLDLLVRERLATARAEAARQALAAVAGSPRRSLSAVVARALARLARRVAVGHYKVVARPD